MPWSLFLMILLGGAGLVVGCWSEEWRVWMYAGSTVLVGAMCLGQWRSTLTWRWVWAIALGLRLIMFPVPPGLSDDVYRYAWDGWQVLHGSSPYEFVPDDTELDWVEEATELRKELNSGSYFSVYPPVSQLVFALGVFLGWGKGIFLCYGINLIISLAELGALWGVWKLAKKRFLWYAWNPLVLVECWGQVHGEALAIGFLAGGVLALRSGRMGWAVGLVTLAGWVKLHPLFLLPLLLPWVGWRKLVGVFALVTVGVWAPFFSWESVRNIGESIGLYARFYEFNAGPYLLVKWFADTVLGATGLLGGGDSSKVVGTLFQISMLAALPLLWGLSWRNRWSFEKGASAVYALVMVLSTTVHPWYLIPILFFSLVSERGWAWWGLGIGALGTYAFYGAGQEWGYWSAVVLGWSVWLGILVWEQWGRDWVLVALRWRARGKAKRIREVMKRSRIALPFQGRCLDLGAGEGLVGKALEQTLGADEVVLADVLDRNETDLRHVCYGGNELPFKDGEFDLTALVFVLHHCSDSKGVLQEALRVTRGSVVVLESTYRTVGEKRWLRRLDVAVNRLRSEGAMVGQEELLCFRMAEEWSSVAESLGAEVCFTEELGWGPFRTTTLLLRRDT